MKMKFCARVAFVLGLFVVCTGAHAMGKKHPPAQAECVASARLEMDSSFYSDMASVVHEGRFTLRKTLNSQVAVFHAADLLRDLSIAEFQGPIEQKAKLEQILRFAISKSRFLETFHLGIQVTPNSEGLITQYRCWGTNMSGESGPGYQPFRDVVEIRSGRYLSDRCFKEGRDLFCSGNVYFELFAEIRCGR